MTSTSFSPSADRRKRLAQQMLDAQSHGHDQQLWVLRSQWVHRYGVDDLPDLAALPVEQGPAVPAATSPSSAPPLTRLTALLKESLLEVSSSLHEDRAMPAISPAAEPPAPPLTTPRSLRRWLVQDGDDVQKTS